MKIKICGITRSEDVHKCEGSGANLIGFINIGRSKRFVDILQIRALVSTMKHKEKAVIVLEPEDIEEVVMKVKKTGIRTVQLHSLTHNQIKYLKWIEGFQRDPYQRSLKIIRAIGISNESVKFINGNDIRFTNSKIKEIQDFAKTCDAILFDYQLEGKSGGTGKQIPIQIALKAVKIAKKANNCIKVFLAGGVNSEMINNKKEILEKVFDYVDVNSGVEDAPGIKNPNRLDELMGIQA